MSQDEQIARAEAVQAKYQEMLMRKPHVVGVGVGLAKEAEVFTQQIALVVMVEKKIPPEDLHPDDLIPTELDGVRVDVQEVGIFTAQ